MKWHSYGHWRSRFEIDPERYHGFIYEVTFLLTGQRYIGKKAFHKSSKWGTRKKGSNGWKLYTTSSDEVNKLIDEFGMECFFFEILFVCCTKSCWSNAESNLMHKLDVLTHIDPLWGEKMYMNKQIGAVRWIPKPCIAIEAINEKLKEQLPEHELQRYECKR